VRRELGLLQGVAHDAVPAGHGVAVLDAAQLLLGDEPVVEAEPERDKTIRGAERELDGVRVLLAVFQGRVVDGELEERRADGQERGEEDALLAAAPRERPEEDDVD